MQSEEPALQIRAIDVGAQRLRIGIRPGTGEGPPLLLCNGIGASIELVEPFIAALDGVETIVFDAPGVGGSPRPALPYRFWNLACLVVRLLDQLGYREVDALGVSWGGGLAQQFAIQHPSRCRKLILAATSAGALMVPGRPSIISKLLSPRRYLVPSSLARIAPVINARILASLIPQAQLHIVNSGHLFLVTRAQEVAPIIKQFLRRAGECD